MPVHSAQNLHAELPSNACLGLPGGGVRLIELRICRVFQRVWGAQIQTGRSWSSWRTSSSSLPSPFLRSSAHFHFGSLSFTRPPGLGTTGFAGFLRSPRKRAPLYPGGVGTLVEVISASIDAVAQVLRPLCPSTLVDGRVHRISVSVVVGSSVFLQPSVELRLLLVRCSSEDVVELSQRVLNFDESGLWTKQSPLQGCCLLCSFATIYLQCFPSRPRAYDPWVEQPRSHYPHKIWLPSLTHTYWSGWERTLSMIFCFHPPWAQLDSRGRVGRFSRSAKVQKLPTSRSSSELSAHQMAPSGVIAH